LHIINFNNLCFRVENETTLISAKNRVDLSSISEVRSYITEWPRFFGPPCMCDLENSRTKANVIQNRFLGARMK